MREAAFFYVETDSGSFEVTVGDMTARAMGTAFEVADLDDLTVVAVREGRVEVRAGGEVWMLHADERLLWTPEEGGRI